MGPDPKILDDIARAAGGAVNILSGLRQQIREEVKSRVEEVADRLDLVPREDMDRAWSMIAALEQRIAVLEKQGKPEKAKKPSPAQPKKKPSPARKKRKQAKQS